MTDIKVLFGLQQILFCQVNPSETMHNNNKKNPTAYLWLLMIVFRVLFFPAYC